MFWFGFSLSPLRVLPKFRTQSPDLGPAHRDLDFGDARRASDEKSDVRLYTIGVGDDDQRRKRYNRDRPVGG